VDRFSKPVRVNKIKHRPMDTIKKITLFIIFLCLSTLVWGQIGVPKTLHLKDGSFLLGSLVGKSNEVYIWQLTDGTQITLPKDQVRFIKEQKENFMHIKNGKIKKSKGFYGLIMAGSLFEKKLNEWSQEDHSLSVNLTVGYQLNSKISLGLGTGFDAYGTPIIPLFLDLRGDLLNTAVTPYYKLSLGYGFDHPTTEQKSNDDIEYNGGVLLHPSVGLKFYTRGNLAWLLDFGYRFQRYDRAFSWEANPQRWTLQRTTFRIGIEF